MAQTQVVQARVNKEIKMEASEILATMGLTVSDAVRILLTRIVTDKAMPAGLFRPNVETLAAMQDAVDGNVETVSLGSIRAGIRKD